MNPHWISTLSLGKDDQSRLILYGVLVLAAIHVFFPRLSWWFSEGWKFRDGDVEPSSLWLFFNRVGGLIAVVAILYALQHPDQVQLN